MCCAPAIWHAILCLHAAVTVIFLCCFQYLEPIAACIASRWDVCLMLVGRTYTACPRAYQPCDSQQSVCCCYLKQITLTRECHCGFATSCQVLQSIIAGFEQTIRSLGLHHFCWSPYHLPGLASWTQGRCRLQLSDCLCHLCVVGAYWNSSGDYNSPRCWCTSNGKGEGYSCQVSLFWDVLVGLLGMYDLPHHNVTSWLQSNCKLCYVW